MTRIHRSPEPTYRVLLLDGRWDGLPTEAEDLIAGNLGRSGLNIDLDAISDPPSTLRVLNEHPEALDGYDAVLAVSPLRSSHRGAARVLTRIIDRVSTRMPTLIVDHRPRSATRDDSPVATEAPGWRVDTLLLPPGVEPISAARQIAAALHVLLDQLETHLPAASVVVTVPPTAASLVRDDLGALAAGRLDWIARVARDTFGLAFAEVNLLDLDSITTIASSGALPRSHSADDSLTAIALRTTAITVMADTWLDPTAYERTPTHGRDAVRFYAACPIRSDTGEPIGTLCIWDTDPHPADDFDFTALQDLALLTEGELIDARQLIP